MIESIRQKLLESSSLKGLSCTEKQYVIDKVAVYLLTNCAGLPEKSQLLIGKALVRFRAIDYIRHEQTKRKVLHELSNNLRGAILKDDPLAEVITKEFRSDLLKAMVASLNKIELQAIYLRFYESKKLSDIANTLQVSITTAHKLILKALSKLQQKLQDYSDLSYIVLNETYQNDISPFEDKLSDA